MIVGDISSIFIQHPSLFFKTCLLPSTNLSSSFTKHIPSLGTILQAALSFLSRLSDVAERLVAWSCLATAAALALGLVRLAALPLLGAALGSWGAKKARRKAQGRAAAGMLGCWAAGLLGLGVVETDYWVIWLQNVAKLPVLFWVFS